MRQRWLKVNTLQTAKMWNLIPADIDTLVSGDTPGHQNVPPRVMNAEADQIAHQFYEDPSLLVSPNNYPLPFRTIERGRLQVLRVSKSTSPWKELIAIMVLTNNNPVHVAIANGLKNAVMQFGDKKIG
jgi:hypothetical protein